MNEKISWKTYFEDRNVSLPNPSTAVLPKYLLDVLGGKDKDIKILDIGCGYGTFLFALKNEGYSNVQGIDISEEAVAYCVKQGLSVRQMDVLQQDDGIKYDFVIMSHVLEHLPKDLIIPTLSVVRSRILKPMGQLCVMVPNAQSSTDSYWAYEDFTHNTLFTSGSLLFVLRQAGFRQIDFLDMDGLSAFDKNSFEYHKRKFLLELYITSKLFWNKYTGSSYHRPSPIIVTWEIKCLATKSD